MIETISFLHDLAIDTSSIQKKSCHKFCVTEQKNELEDTVKRCK